MPRVVIGYIVYFMKLNKSRGVNISDFAVYVHVINFQYFKYLQRFSTLNPLDNYKCSVATFFDDV